MSIDKKGITIGIIAVLFMTQFLTLSLILPKEIGENEEQTLNSPRFAEPHVPIQFGSNGDMDSYFTGDGLTGLSWAQAHRIENYIIDGNYAVSPIQITGTSIYLIIRNCTLINSNTSSGYAGIVLDNVQHVRIENCSISGNSNGIRLTGCNDVYVHNNTILMNTLYGIYSSSDPAINALNITNNIIQGFSLFGTQPYGIYLDSATNHLIENNKIASSDTCGIYLTNTAATNTIRRNYIFGGNYGINLNGISNNIIEWNNITNNYGTGIYITGNFVGGNTIQRNNISYNNVGINSNSLTFTANNIYWNILSNNSINATESNAFTTNVWDDGNFGNYWGEYVYEHPSATNNGLTWNEAHAVDGSSAATDAHPIVNAQFIYNTAPTISNPADKIITVDSTGNTLDWTVTDESTQNPVYNLTVNGFLVRENLPFLSNVPIPFNLDDLTSGVYTFNILANDGFGLTVTDSAVVTVVQTANQSQVLQTSTWGSTGNDMGLGICTYQNATYTVGSTTSVGAGLADLVLIKWDDNGNRIWTSTWGGQQDESGSGVWANDTVVYTVGSTRSWGIGESDILVVKWNATNGDQIWNKTVGDLSVDYGNAIWANESHIFITGAKTTPGNATDIILTLLLEDGSEVYSRTWGGNSPDIGNAIWVNSTDVYIYGITESFDITGGDMVILRYDVSGNLLLNKTSGCSMAVAGNSIWSDGISLYGVGSIVNSTTSNTDLILFCLSAMGDQIWNRTFGGLGIDVGRAITGNYTGLYITGFTESFGPAGRNGLFLKYSFTGDIMDNASIWDGSGTDQLMAIAGNDSYIYTTGYSGANANTLVLLKWDANCTAPRSFAINPQINYINLTWVAPSNNGGMTIFVYNIYRSTNNHTFTYLTNKLAPSVEFKDDTVVKGQYYYYKIVAFTMMGENAFTGFLGAIAFQNINDSVDYNAMFTMSGAGWVGQTDVVFFDGDAVASNPIAAGASTSFQTVVNGPGVLIFTWKVSSQANAGILNFIDNGTTIGSGITGEINWVEVRHYVTPGVHTLQWSYSKVAVLPAGGQDKAWVDLIQFSPILPLNPEFPVNFEGIIGRNNMSIFYNVSLNGGDNISVSLNGSAFSEPNLDLFVYNSNLNLIASNLTGAYLNINTIIEGTGQYYIRIFNNGSATDNLYFGNITKIVENGAPIIFINEPNGLNLSAQAIDINFGDTYSLDDAYYRIDSPDLGWVNDTTGWYPIFINHTGNSYTDDIWIDQTYWNTFTENTMHTIYFKVWDDVGNYANATGYHLDVYKDTVKPTILVTPLANEYWASNQTITALFTDLNSIESAYYIVDTALPANISTTGMTAIFTNHHSNMNLVQFSLTSAQWTTLGQGAHTIRIKCWDDATNMQNVNISIYKDTVNPSFTIRSANRTEFTKTPSILIDVNDTLALKSVYFKIDSNSPAGTDVTGWTLINGSLTGLGYTINFSMNDAAFAGLTAGEHAMYFKVMDQANNVINPTLPTWNFIKKLLPTTPTLSEIKEINTNGTIVLSWTASEHVVSYYVYRSTIPFTNFNVEDLEAIAVITTGTTYTDKIPLNGTYYYIVAGRNADGYGAASNMINVTVAIPPATAVQEAGIIGGFTLPQLLIIAGIVGAALVVALIVQGSVLKKKYLTAADQVGGKAKPSGKSPKQEQFDFSKMEEPKSAPPKKTAPTPRPVDTTPQETKKIIKDEKPPQNTRSCSNCGSKIEASSTFCPFCGRTLD